MKRKRITREITEAPDDEILDVQKFKDALEIDPNNLDRDLIRQPVIYHQIADAYALTVSRRDELKDKIKMAQADAGKRIREKLEVEGEKVTEKRIDAEVETDKQVAVVRRQYRLECEAADRLSALRESFHQRSHALKILSELWVANYWGQNSTRTDDVAAVSESAYMSRREKMNQQRQNKRKQNERA